MARTTTVMALTIGLMAGGGATVASVDREAAEVIEPSSSPAPAPAAREHSLARWRFTALSLHGPLARLGSNDYYELAVYADASASGQVATLRKVAGPEEASEPADEQTARFSFAPRPLIPAERVTVSGTKWEDARVLEVDVVLAGAFARQPIHLDLWIAGEDVAGTWSIAAQERRGGPVLGSDDPRPPTLRDAEALPCLLQCAALSSTPADGACEARCTPSV